VRIKTIVQHVFEVCGVLECIKTVVKHVLEVCRVLESNKTVVQFVMEVRSCFVLVPSHVID